MRLGSGRNYLSQWKPEQLPQFMKKLRPTDEVAVEITGNTRVYIQQFKSLPRASPITAGGDDARLVV